MDHTRRSSHDSARTLFKMLQTLTPHEEYLLRSRFGIGTELDRSLMAERKGDEATAVQTHQLEHKSLRKLRSALSMVH